ncbi:transposase family protein [Streptomyces griseochromogenes]|uniref:transposase family protein n=1 Tax=Streptomyces griseochromogenes TaxID=68214 RepID=UPI0009A08A08
MPAVRPPGVRVHSRYWRHIADLPLGGQKMAVHLRVRRFFCDQGECRRRTFVEQVAGLTERRLSSSTAARSAMRAIAVQLGGRPVRRLCRKLQLHGRRSSLLGQLTSPPAPARAPRILGIDEFAFHRGRTYGTVLVDAETSIPVDVLPDRETRTVAAWLRQPSSPRTSEEGLLYWVHRQSSSSSSWRASKPPTRLKLSARFGGSKTPQSRSRRRTSAGPGRQQFPTEPSP